MPMKSTDTLLRTIADQNHEIDELKFRIAELESLLSIQAEVALAGELAALIFDHPDELENAIIASTHCH